MSQVSYLRAVLVVLFFAEVVTLVAGNVARAYVWGCHSGRSPYCGAPGGGAMAAPGQTNIPDYTVVRQGW